MIDTLCDEIGRESQIVVDELAVFNKALSRDKICELYTKATGKPVIASFSLWLRIAAGRLTTRAPCASASSSR